MSYRGVELEWERRGQIPTSKHGLIRIKGNPYKNFGWAAHHFEKDNQEEYLDMHAPRTYLCIIIVQEEKTDDHGGIELLCSCWFTV